MDKSDSNDDYHQIYGDMLDIEQAEPAPPLVAQYERAIREGDLAYVVAFIDLYHHVEVPVLDLPPYQLLAQANHDILQFLDEKEYTNLPDIAAAIVWDDPLLLGRQDLTYELVEAIFKYDAYNIFLEVREPITSLIRTTCMRDPYQCDKLITSIHGSIARDLFRDPVFANMYLNALSRPNIQTLTIIAMNNTDKGVSQKVSRVAQRFGILRDIEENVARASQDPQFRNILNNYD